MPFVYWVVVTVHILSAMLWIGGMLFLAAVGAPALRAVEPQLRQQIFRDLGLRFREVGNIAVAVLIATGVLLLRYRGWLRWDGVLGDATFWSTRAGFALAWKLSAVAVMLVVSALHDFVLGPAASRANASAPEGMRLRRHASLVARLSAVAGLVVVGAAVVLARS